MTILFCTLTLMVSVFSVFKKNNDFSPLEYRILQHPERPDVQGVVSGDYFAGFERGNLDQVIGRDFFIVLDSRLQRLIGKHEVNAIIVGRKGSLLRWENDCYDCDYNIPREFDGPEFDLLQKIKAATDSYGGYMYYMNIYPRETYMWDRYVYPQKDAVVICHEKNANLLQYYENAGIDCVDTYPIFENDPDDYLYFNTDHHYTFRAAYYCYKELLASVNAVRIAEGKESLTIPEWDEMEYFEVPGKFEGRLSGVLGDLDYNGDDHLDYALPYDYPVRFDRFEYTEPVEAETIRSEGAPEYGYFMDGDNGNTVVKTYREDLPNILIIGCSYSNALEVLAVYNFNEMHSIDPRYFEEDIAEYIKKNRIDHVVVQGELVTNLE